MSANAERATDVVTAVKLAKPFKPSMRLKAFVTPLAAKIVKINASG